MFVKSTTKDISVETLNKILETDRSEKNIEGTRVVSFVDMSDKVKDKLAEIGVTPDNTLIIEEGATASGNKGMGWLFGIAGILMVFGSAASFIKKMKDA